MSDVTFLGLYQDLDLDRILIKSASILFSNRHLTVTLQEVRLDLHADCD